MTPYTDPGPLNFIEYTLKLQSRLTFVSNAVER